MTRKIISLLIVVMLLMAIAIIPASAAETVQRRATCGYCGASQSWTYSKWDTYRTDKIDCSHYNFGKDYKYYKRRLVTVVCSGCSNGDSTYYEYRTRTVCNGFNNAK